jgi:hypothetical protein
MRTRLLLVTALVIGLTAPALADRRDDAKAQVSFGIDVARWKITAFTLGNFLIGIAGALFGMVGGFVAPNNYTFSDSLLLVSIVVLALHRPLHHEPAHPHVAGSAVVGPDDRGPDGARHSDRLHPLQSILGCDAELRHDAPEVRPHS